MDSCKNVIDVAKPHSIKKFELINSYVDSWSHILLGSDKCDCIIYMDVMCNSGEYYTDDTKETYIEGTALKVANTLEKVAKEFPKKKVYIIFNDIDKEKIDYLSAHLPKNFDNFTISVFNKDANTLLKEIRKKILSLKNTNYLLVYDPYQDKLDWDAIIPFLGGWGEIIINHMVYDVTRGLSVAKQQAVIDKYEKTYQRTVEDLLRVKTKNELQLMIENIVSREAENQHKEIYIAVAPFYNKKNGLVFNLIHCSGHERGFNVFKSKAWGVFGGHSTSKTNKNTSQQISLDFENECGIAISNNDANKDVTDIAIYLQKRFRNKIIKLEDMWKVLKKHPVFPCEDFKRQIKDKLKGFGTFVRKGEVIFSEVDIDYESQKS